MNKSTNSAATALLALSLTSVLLAVGQAQDGGQRPQTAPTSMSQQPGALGGRVGLRQPMSPEEKLIRNAYVKLMRYQSAALDELAAKLQKDTQPEDYLRFELRDVHTGPIAEISSRPLSELVTPPGGDIVTVKPNHRVWGNGPAHAYYEAEWAGASDTQQTGESATVEEMLRSGGEKFLGVEKYTTYQVSVRLERKQRIYRSMALHYGKSETGKKGSEIIDNITSELNTVLAEESPRVRSPWKTYVRTSLYLAVAREIRDKRTMGLPLIPDNSPIGYLPGDDVAMGARDADFSLALTCEPPVEVPRIEWVKQEIIDESQQGEEVTECGRFVVRVKYRVSCDPVVHSLEVDGHITDDADFICNQSSELVQNDDNEVCTWVVRKLYRMRNRMSQGTGTAFTSYRAKLTEGSKAVTKDGPGVSVRATIPGTAPCQGSVPCH